MFKLDQSGLYAWPVTVQVPTDGGTWTAETFDAQFKRLPDSQLQKMRAAVMAGELTDKAFALTVVGGWAGVTDNGQEVPFTMATLERLLEIPGVATAVVLAFVESQAGAPRKN